GIWHLYKMEGVVNRLAQEETQKLSQAEQWLRGISVNLVRSQTTLLVTDEEELLRQFKLDMDATSKDISERQKAVDALVGAGKGRDILAKVAEARERYRTTRAKLIERRTAGDNVGVEVFATMKPQADAYLALVQEFVNWQQNELETARANANQAASSARIQMIVAALLSLLAATVVGWLLSRSIVAPLLRARDSARQIAGGDLTVIIDSKGNDEAAEMLAALADMQGSLRKIVDEVRIGAENVSTASSQIAAGNIDLSSRTEQQASSIEETAASLEELTSTVNQNAENTREADRLAVSASQIANRGGEVVNQVVMTMDIIQGSSKKISEIIGVIDGIAFQTNILALNAAVEAARAGEQGRGFAVVAAEVRSLAQRSAAAAKEIKGLINESVETVGNGSRLVDDAGRTMLEVVKSVKQVSDIIGEIATATREQSAGIGQVNTAVLELERVTQQNASLVEESAAASESLKEQATRLATSVGVFRVDRDSASQSTLQAPALDALPATPARKALKHNRPVTRNNILSFGKSRLAAHAVQLAEGDSWREF
ncbi:MAG: HAMP domain-containing protein, partial [Betaproteobacteria bacterium]|nr:HAMP domain-containing protein [Betaproteobacteria bacterium]